MLKACLVPKPCCTHDLEGPNRPSKSSLCHNPKAADSVLECPVGPLQPEPCPPQDGSQACGSRNESSKQMVHLLDI